MNIGIHPAPTESIYYTETGKGFIEMNLNREMAKRREELNADFHCKRATRESLSYTNRLGYQILGLFLGFRFV